jgi:hypothetical protein
VCRSRRFVGPRLSGQGTQYFSDRTYGGGLIGNPFDPNRTDQLGVSIWESTGYTQPPRAPLVLPTSPKPGPASLPGQ